MSKNRILADFKNLIPNKLYIQLTNHNTLDTENTLKIKPDKFAKLKGVGKKTVKQLIEFQMMLSDIETNFSSLNNVILLPKTHKTLDVLDKSKFFQIMESIINDYFNILDDTRSKDIVFRRFGIDNIRTYTLEDIATYYNRTRERIRQIQNKHLNTLRNIFEKGESIKPKFKIHPDFFAQITKFKSKLSLEITTNEKHLRKILAEYYPENTRYPKTSVFKLYMFIFGYVDFNFNSYTFFYKPMAIKRNVLDRIVSIVYIILLETVKPISEFELLIEIKRKMKDSTPDDKTLRKILITLPFLEFRINELDGYIYQIALTQLTNKADRAYLVLQETNKEMRFKDIDREVKHRLISSGYNASKVNTITGNCLSSDSRFSPLGRSGMWALSEWKVSSESILDLINKAFMHENKPLKRNEIYNYVLKIRPSVKKQTISCLLSDFIKTDIGLIPEEWISEYKKYLSKKPKHFDKENFRKYLNIFYSRKHTNILKWNDIKKEISEELCITEHSAYNRFCNSPFLIKKKIKRYMYFQLERSYLIKEQKPTLLQQISEDAYSIINDTPQKALELRTLCNELKKKYKTGSIYKAISNDKRFKKFSKNGISCVTMTTKTSTRINHDILLIDQIKKGESQTQEFKSTLFYDRISKTKNQKIAENSLKTVCAFLNTKGGTLILGVDDDKNIIGLSNDLALFDNSGDKFVLALDNLISDKISPNFISKVKSDIVNVDDKTICQVSVAKSDTPAYLKFDSKSEFYIRGTASNRKLDSRQTTEYISSHFIS